jgi:hypothetical protein
VTRRNDVEHDRKRQFTVRALHVLFFSRIFSPFAGTSRRNRTGITPLAVAILLYKFYLHTSMAYYSPIIG